MPTHSESANAIRFLSMDAVQQANSGHPGAPMGMADIATVLWQDFLRHNPRNPHWPNRDRFILSNGHGSMLLYSLLHLSGYELSMDELKNFRQLHSKTPGHPESTVTPGVETTTGPLGQGLANAVGMAIAEKQLAATFNRENLAIVDHFTYVFMGDGCLMEGISHEVCSLAGTLELGKLIAFWDDNHISIDGDVDGWFTDDTAGRFKAYGWQVIADVDGHDPRAIKAAIEAAQAETGKPSLICCKTIIGWGAPTLAGSEKTHGAPLGATEIQAARQALHWPHPPFHIPAALYQAWDHQEMGARQEQSWRQLFERYQSAHPELAAEFERRQAHALPADWQQSSQAFLTHCQHHQTSMATRKASQVCLEHFCQQLPELLGGSADLTGSNLTHSSRSVAFSAEHPAGNYLHYGVREFGMSAIMNGLQLHGGVRPYGGTFLTFSDYARNAVRMAALMNLPAVFVYTHDSIGLGEDGPTHQAIEHAASLRLIPNLEVWRPCDLTETAAAWQAALEAPKNPSCLLLSRQNLTPQPRTGDQVTDIVKGGYILQECAESPALIVIATGSEVELAQQAVQRAQDDGLAVRLVSMPCCERFEQQPAAYREAVLPKAVRRRLVIEAGASGFWYKYVGLDGRVIGIDRFGESAPGPVVYETLGITVQAIQQAIIALIHGEIQ